MTVADLVIDVFRLCDRVDELERGINNKELVAFTSYIYPNPAQTNFNVPLGTQKVNIINNVGQLVLNTDNPTNNTVDISMLQPGIYIVQLFINNQWVSNKLVKQ
jgi:hypothetical protein